MVSAVITVNPSVLRHLSRRPWTGKPSELRLLALKADRLTEMVQSRWSDLEPAQRDTFVALAYRLLEDEPDGVWPSVRRRLSGALLALLGHEQGMAVFTASVSRLAEAVLDAIEREDPRYRERLGQAVDQALTERGHARIA